MKCHESPFNSDHATQTFTGRHETVMTCHRKQMRNVYALSDPTTERLRNDSRRGNYQLNQNGQRVFQTHEKHPRRSRQQTLIILPTFAKEVNRRWNYFGWQSTARLLWLNRLLCSLNRALTFVLQTRWKSTECHGLRLKLPITGLNAKAIRSSLTEIHRACKSHFMFEKKTKKKLIIKFAKLKLRNNFENARKRIQLDSMQQRQKLAYRFQKHIYRKQRQSKSNQWIIL